MVPPCQAFWTLAAALLAQGLATAPVIVDTDMNVDDMAALVYLVRSGADIRGVTVSATGFSAQWAGADSALRLLHKLNRSDIPVAFQQGFLSSTRLNLDYPRGLPPTEWTEASNHYLKKWVATEPSPKPAAWQSAGQLMVEILQESPDNSVHILELGPCTNLAAALHRPGSEALFRSKVKTLYVQGGAFEGSQQLAGPALRGAGPSFPWTSDKKPAGASWNVFLDAISAAQVFSFGLPTVLIPDSAFEPLQVDPSDPRTYVPPNCSNDLLRDIMLNWAPSQNEEWTSVRYWDQATTVAMMQRLRGQESMCQHWVASNITVSLQNDASYATYNLGGPGAPSQACLATSRASFLQDFYSAGCI